MDKIEGKGSVFGLLVPDVFKRFSVSPRVSFWISTAALSIVLFNNHIYITHVQEREREANIMIQRNIVEANNLTKREAILRSWEISLYQREIEVKKLISELGRAKSAR